ncbi:hypothetical protein [Longimicrobium sp.]|jgi:hypothetical protein|uniref:hypothetical protein n=1 Tax=Longimicrobium sp. TaxID=2029185 RepID=UPI002ED98315
MNISKIPAVFAALLVSVAAACGETPSGPGENPAAGEVRFTYTSANSTLAGTFQAKGAPLPTGGTDRQWAAGTRSDDPDQVLAFGIVPLSGESYDQVAVHFPGSGVGTYSAGAACEGDHCAGVAFSLGTSTGGVPTWVCVSVAGNVEVTSSAADRVRGKFSGTLHCYSPAAPGQQPVLEMTGGTFDVALVELPE